MKACSCTSTPSTPLATSKHCLIQRTICTVVSGSCDTCQYKHRQWNSSSSCWRQVYLPVYQDTTYRLVDAKALDPSSQVTSVDMGSVSDQRLPVKPISHDWQSCSPNLHTLKLKIPQRQRVLMPTVKSSLQQMHQHTWSPTCNLFASCCQIRVHPLNMIYKLISMKTFSWTVVTF